MAFLGVVVVYPIWAFDLVGLDNNVQSKGDAFFGDCATIFSINKPGVVVHTSAFLVNENCGR